MADLLGEPEIMKKTFNTLVKHLYIPLLIVVNFITNYLFILQYKFYSDDWALLVNPFGSQQTYWDMLLASDRPIYFAIIKFQAYVFQDFALIYHLLGFITTSIILILIYKIAQKLFSDFDYKSAVYPFLAALIFCVLFNKDELYPFSLVALGVYSILYLVSFYTYINKEKKYFLGFSLAAYTIGVFTYESGITLPVIFFAYDFLLKKDYKKSFLFAIPLVFNLIVRKTDWFGFGHTPYSSGFGQWGIQSLFSNSFDFISASVFIVIRQILYALQGLQAMGCLPLILIIVINLTVLYILYKVIDFSNIPRSGNCSFGILLAIITAVFAAPFILRGGLLSGSLPTRSFEFVDIGIAFFCVFIIAYFSKPQILKIILLLFIGLCIFLCQGLYMNWVISGDLQNDVYRYIGDHSAEIQSADYVYFNTPSFIASRPNSIDESVFYPIAKIYYTYIRHDTLALEQRMNTQQLRMKDPMYTNEYDRYYNAKGLDNYALASMLSQNVEGYRDKDYNKYLIYGKTNNVPVSVTNESMIIQQPYPGGENITVEKSRIFEINYNLVYPAG